ncbi:RNA polymerase factor sigma-54 [Lottiidibacillus patelloidae]|nr:RNA polymerase factor sigma-54 [Lottiidibacillus patelloidae]
MKVGLFQTQRQTLALTNQLRQAIELLQYSTMDLSQFIKEQAMDNPLIDIEEPRMSAISETYVTSTSKYKNIDGINSEDLTLSSYLLQQLIDFNVKLEEKEIINYLIMSLNDKGYIVDSLTEIAETLKYPIEKIKAALEILQQFDPAGIGAENLQQCLLLQLKRKNRKFPIAEIMVKDHLEDVARKNWDKIAKDLAVSVEEVKHSFAIIKTLNPNPASGYGEKPNYIIPDFQVIADSEDPIIVLNDHLLPKISVNQHYEMDLTSHPEASDYIKIQLQHYRWLARSISQRKTTLQNVMEIIVQKQRTFFIESPNILVPLTMKEVSEVISIHESTVSRAVKNKYVQTNHGVYPLKTFFTSKIKNMSGKDSSSFVVKKQLIKLIAEENKENPLSDQQIVDVMKLEGLDISRRTISKYRNQLGISSSSMRKER